MMDMERGHGLEDEGDAAERAFEALRAEVAAQRGPLERLAAALDELSRRPAPDAPDYDHTLGVLAKTLHEVGGRVDAIGAAVGESVTGLARDVAQTRLVVRDAATAAQGAAEQGRDAARGAAKHAGSVREALLNDRATVTLVMAALLMVGGLGVGSGWGLRGWWAPPSSEVFARYLAAGNEPGWLACEGAGTRFVSTQKTPACELKFWLQNPGP